MDGTDHPSHASRTDDPERLATQALALLRRDIEQRFGLRVRVGVEQEFCLRIKPDADVMQQPFYHHDPLQWGHQKPDALPHSRIVAYGYREGAGDGAVLPGKPSLRQYEVVTDHLHPLPIERLPKAISDLRHELESPRPSKKRLPKGDSAIDAISRTRAKQYDWQNNNVASVLFDSKPSDLSCSGLHINVSVEELRGGRPALQAQTALMNTLQASTRDLFDTHATLHAADAGQIERLRAQRSMGILRSRPTDNIAGAPSYLENRYAGADSNPYYCLLLQVAALHDALAQTRHHAPASHNLATILNQLEPELGTRFLNAAEQHPERKVHQSRAAQLSAALA